jgi:hypothetical protein
MTQIADALIGQLIRVQSGPVPPDCQPAQPAFAPANNLAELVELSSGPLQLILGHLTTSDLGCFAATCRRFWGGTTMPCGTSPVEEMLRKRAYTVGQRAIGQLPPQMNSWVSHLLWREFLVQTQEAAAAVTSDGMAGGGILCSSNKWRRRGAITSTSPGAFRCYLRFGERC